MFGGACASELGICFENEMLRCGHARRSMRSVDATIRKGEAKNKFELHKCEIFVTFA